MLVKLKLEGSGTHEDPFHVKYPEYRMVEVDYAAMVAICDVPTRTLPVDLKATTADVTLDKGDLQAAIKDAKGGDSGKRTPAPTHKNVTVDAHPTEIAAWHEHLDEMYAEHAGKFRPLT